MWRSILKKIQALDGLKGAGDAIKYIPCKTGIPTNKNIHGGSRDRKINNKQRR